MTGSFSKNQIDQLGNRLREGPVSESDLRMLDEYRLTFTDSYSEIVHSIRQQLHLDPTGRPAKSTSSIIEKLRRESIRLSQMQDIAGCRTVLEDSAGQEQIVHSLRALFPHASVVDRRARPSHGYRAVHLIARLRGSFVEIQVRSSLQHLWAELSEMWADEIDPSIKYGGGPETNRQLLAQLSRTIAKVEILDVQLPGIRAQLSQMRPLVRSLGELDSKVEQIQQHLAGLSKQLSDAKLLLHSQLQKTLSSRSKRG
jgi:ppGpp synthetase/RelA/SpoT-type nucleotidyltranferase